MEHDADDGDDNDVADDVDDGVDGDDVVKLLHCGLRGVFNMDFWKNRMLLDVRCGRIFNPGLGPVWPVWRMVVRVKSDH